MEWKGVRKEGRKRGKIGSRRRKKRGGKEKNQGEYKG